MQSNKFVETANKIIHSNPEVFAALEEYDKTHRLRKLSYRRRLNITIDADVLKRYRKYCAEHQKNMSRSIESYMKQDMGRKERT